MSRKKKKIILQYTVHPILFLGIITAILLVSGKPILSMMKANLNMVIAKGAPGYSNEYTSEYSSLFLSNKPFDREDIQIPEYGAKYGNILCESIEMKVPLYYGDSDNILEKGAGQYIASGLPGEGKTILIGGHDSIYFAPLENIHMGDIIEIETNYGVFLYQVTNTAIAEADDTSAYSINQEKEELILYTCYPFGQLLGKRSQRYFIYCEKMDNES